METPLKVVFHDLERSDAIEEAVRRHAAELEHFYDRITSCRVVVEAPHRSKHRGRIYSVRIDLSVPRKEIIVNQSGGLDHAHEDVYVAIGHAFKAATRQLEDHVRRMRGDVKMHEVPPHGRVARLHSDEGYGFIETIDGDQFYFHENAVLDDAFDDLEVGTEVRFAIGQGDEGPTASSVRPVGRHHHLE